MNKQQTSTSLVFCVLMDLIGCATYTIPVLGEFGDIIWAPLSAIIFYKTFGGWKGAFGGLFNFFEEILPGTDFIPSFTIMWFMQRMKNPRPVKTGVRVGSNWVITEGLKEGEKVALIGNAIIKPGMQIKPVVKPYSYDSTSAN